ncbi:tetratricopeptide repeat protein [Streptomyces sp. NPDC058426]|uniref:tetratricopeptide repeat protein n=1 Tax=Streptomyces sp. NPDC058426 TaxID=3346493 RepID=UPI00364D6DE5
MMSAKASGGRPWGPIRAQNPEAHKLARTLREHVERSGKTLAALGAEIHLSKSQVGAYLAGKIPPEEFIHELMKATVPSALRGKCTQDALALRQQALLPVRRAAPRAHGPEHNVELAAAQSRQLETYDRLTRSLEQQAEIERAKNNSDKLVMVLLNMLHQLDRRVADLTRERDQLRAGPGSEALKDAERKLARAEEQEKRAQAELKRAEEKQRQAEALEARVAERLRHLNEELDRLRGSDNDLLDSALVVPEQPDHGRTNAATSDPVGDDIDEVLARASAVNDEDTSTLSQVSSELDGETRHVVQDKPSDNERSEGHIPFPADAPYEYDLVDLAVQAVTAAGASAVESSAQRVEVLEKAKGSFHLETLLARRNHAVAVGKAGWHERARHLHAALLPQFVNYVGDDHPETLIARYRYAVAFAADGDAESAAAVLDGLVPRMIRFLGLHHAETVGARTHHAQYLGATGRHEESLRLFDEIVSDLTSLLGPTDLRTLIVQCRLARVLNQVGRHDAALKLLDALFPRLVQSLGHDHYEVVVALSDRAFARHVNDPGIAKDTFRDLISQMRTIGTLGPRHPETLIARSHHAYFTGESGDRERAVLLFASLLPALVHVLGRHHVTTLIARRNHAYYKGETASPERAARLFVPLIRAFTEALGPEHIETLVVRRSHAGYVGRAGDAKKAAKLFAELIPLMTLHLGAQHAEVFSARSHYEYYNSASGVR